MSDFKYCPSCGTTLSLSAGFCHKCGHKQIMANAESMVSKENIAPVIEEQVLEQEQAPELAQGSEQPQTQIHDQVPVLDQTLEQEPFQGQSHAQAQALEPSQAQAPVRTQAQEQVQPQPQQSQPVCYPQNPLSQPLDAKKEPKKKKFPWFFTVLWTILFIAVAGWGYYLYYLYSVGGDFPQFTVDAQRIVLFTASIALLLYTLSLKLTMRKLKAFPTVILIIALLVIFYLFSMVELTDGDWLHDTISEITNNILPASGN